MTQHAIDWILSDISASSVYNYPLAVHAANTIALGHGEEGTECTGAFIDGINGPTIMAGSDTQASPPRELNAIAVSLSGYRAIR